MATRDLAQRLHHRVRVQLSREAEPDGDVVRRLVRHQLPQEPEARLPYRRRVRVHPCLYFRPVKHYYSPTIFEYFKESARAFLARLLVVRAWVPTEPSVARSPA